MNSHCVIANEGFISGSMGKGAARNYRRKLIELGNYNVSVISESSPVAIRMRRKGGIE